MECFKKKRVIYITYIFYRLVQKIFLKSLDRFKLEQTNKYDEFCDALDKALYGNNLDIIK